jgi:hypothetical protein
MVNPVNSFSNIPNDYSGNVQTSTDAADARVDAVNKKIAELLESAPAYFADAMTPHIAEITNCIVSELKKQAEEEPAAVSLDSEEESNSNPPSDSNVEKISGEALSILFDEKKALYAILGQSFDMIEQLLEDLESSVKQFDEGSESFNAVKLMSKDAAAIRKESPKEINKESVDSYASRATAACTKFRGELQKLTQAEVDRILQAQKQSREQYLAQEKAKEIEDLLQTENETVIPNS